jgi:hypothetical protein
MDEFFFSRVRQRRRWRPTQACPARPRRAAAPRIAACRRAAGWRPRWRRRDGRLGWPACTRRAGGEAEEDPDADAGEVARTLAEFVEHATHAVAYKTWWRGCEEFLDRGPGRTGERARRELKRTLSETEEELGSMAVDAYASKKQVLQELGGLLEAAEAAAEDAGEGVAEEAAEEAARGTAEAGRSQLPRRGVRRQTGARDARGAQAAEKQGDEQAKMLAQQSRRRRPRACRWRAREGGWRS